MAAFPCPYCGQAVTPDSEDEDERLDQCPSCDRSLQVAYRYRLIAARGKVSGGVLYQAADDGFGETYAVLFVEDPKDAAATERFLEGNRLFAELGGRGLVRIRELGSRTDPRPYVVMDWLRGGTLEAVVAKRGPLDQATLFAVVTDLLSGLSKAHRSMPALVHGHIHPGKIGFLVEDQAVLFGFEWAKQVLEQDSSLADAFTAKDEVEDPDAAHRSTDLQQLGRSIYYAATGEWLAKQSIAQQRARVSERLDGPLAHSVDRMLGAGADGYKSAIDAAIDFEDMLRGSSHFRPRVKPNTQPRNDLATSNWEEEDDDDDDDDDVQEIEDFDQALGSVYGESQSAPSSSPPPTPAYQLQTPRAAAFGEAARKREAQATLLAAQQPKSSSPGKLIGGAIAAMVIFGMCVADIVEDIDDDFDEAPIVFNEPHVAEPIPNFNPDSNSNSNSNYDPALRAEGPNDLSQLHRYTGTITGPEDVAGLAIGDRCEVWVEPNDGGSLNCRWYIDCGEPRRRIYGGGDIGYSTCTIEDGHPTSAQDEDDDAPDGAFMAVLSDVEPMVMVMDRWLLPPTRVLISIDEGGGPHPGPVTPLETAPRMTQEAIEAAVERGEDPKFGGPGLVPAQLSNDQMLGALEEQLDALMDCPVESGVELTLSMNIQPNGRMKGLVIAPEQEPAVNKCVKRVMRRVRFPEFTGEKMSVNWNVSW